MNIALYGRYSERIHHLEHLKELISQLIQYNVHLFIEEEYHRRISHHIEFSEPPTLFRVGDHLAGKVDYMISIGGDGTMLDTVTIIGNSGVPVLGINTGRLGFLSILTKDQIGGAIQRLQEKRYMLNKRALLRADSENNPFGKMNYALNEISIHRKETPSLIAIKVWVNDVFLNAYWADGLIICTPTGSTGYSLSCGGPIVYPQAENFIITPIATHNLTVRPIVIPDNTVVKVEVEEKYGNVTVGLDARTYEMMPGTTYKISKEGFTLNLIQFEEEEFFNTIRGKLKWGLDNRN